MSKTLTLGPVTLALPLVIRDDGHVIDADGYLVTLTTRPLFIASPDLLLAAKALINLVDRGDVGTTARHEATNNLRTAIARARGGT